ncbi:hypothetical protein EG835_11430 [bacterium]|nr:hypothetical protein [bacterium]
MRRDAASGEVLAERELPHLKVGPGCAWSAGGALVIGDYENGEGRAVHEVVIVDPVTLLELFRVEVDGLGCVGPAGKGRFVICEADGDVVVYRASDGTMLAGTSIQGRQEELLEVFYLGEESIDS